MRVFLLAVLCLLILPGPASSQTKKADKKESAPQELKTDKDKLSYALGLNAGDNFKKMGLELNPDVLGQGLKDAYTGGKTRMTREDAQKTLAEYQQAMQKKQSEEMQKMGADNITKSQAFLEENKKKEGVTTTASGLQYKVIQAGSGPKPGPADTVTVHYRGTLIDGTEFDSSYKRNQPASFPLNGVIPGFSEGLQLMETGSKYMFFIPPNLGYGERGGGPIPPNSALIFEIELLKIGK